MSIRFGAAALLALSLAGAARAQSTRTRDTLRLDDLQGAAASRDPRQRQFAYQRTASALRARSIAADRLPGLTAEGMAQYQSDVTTIPIRLPNASVPTPPHDTYDGHVLAQERLVDPTIAPRLDAERATLAETEARLRTTVFGLRNEVNDAFFAAALAQSRAGEIATVIGDLEAQLRIAQSRVREGTALPSEAATIEAELLRRRQDQADLAASRRASLAILATLTGRALGDNDTLALPSLERAVAAGRDSLPRARPEYAQFARARDLLAAQERVVTAQTRPRLSAFGRVGYGKPGLNFLNNKFDSYWLAGVQVQWAPWTWGSNEREREVLAIQREIVASDEEAFTETTRRAVERQLADIDRLEASLRTDDTIIALRARIERETRRRFEEAVVTSAEYVDRRNDLLGARLTRDTHEVELAQARARYLTTIGLELR
jgi:outer membrane protein TolC